jgi:hypothetical protein
VRQEVRFPDERITMPQRFIKCGQCPTWFKTPFSQRKYCAACQIIRDSEVRPHEYGDTGKECISCHAQFLPARPNWKVCASCADPVPQPSRFAPCNRCRESYRTATGLKNTCQRCVQITPQTRREYIEALKQRREVLIGEDPAPPQEYLDWVALYGGETKPPSAKTPYEQPAPFPNRVSDPPIS